MIQHIIPYEQAFTLKCLNINFESIAYYNVHGTLLLKILSPEPSDDITISDIITHKVSTYHVDAPFFDRVFEWFRNTKDLRFHISSNADDEIYGKDTYSITVFYRNSKLICDMLGQFNTYRKAQIELLNILLLEIK